MSPQDWTMLARTLGRLLAVSVLIAMLLLVAGVAIGLFIWIVRNVGGL